MGVMPFGIDKGVVGLRMEYLTRSPAVRAHVLQRLQDREDVFDVQADITIDGVDPINVFTDRKADFARKLDDLLRVDPTEPDPHHGRAGWEYVRDQHRLELANKDSTGNRQAFAKYWLDRRSRVADQVREVLVSALASPHEKIFFWWECTLPHGSKPRAAFRETENAGHVIFLTDHGPVQDPDPGERPPLDDDPAGDPIQG
jgi:hypothetical protein